MRSADLDTYKIWFIVPKKKVTTDQWLQCVRRKRKSLPQFLYQRVNKSCFEHWVKSAFSFFSIKISHARKQDCLKNSYTWLAAVRWSQGCLHWNASQPKHCHATAGAGSRWPTELHPKNKVASPSRVCTPKVGIPRQRHVAQFPDSNRSFWKSSRKGHPPGKSSS